MWCVKNWSLKNVSNDNGGASAMLVRMHSEIGMVCKDKALSDGCTVPCAWNTGLRDLGGTNGCLVHQVTGSGGHRQGPGVTLG